MSGGVLVLLLIIMAIAAPLLTSWFGHPTSEFHQDLIDPNLQRPLHGPWHSGISGNFPLGSSRPTAATSSAGSSTAPGSRC